MENIKDYREKELKMYIIANIFVILLLLNIFKIDDLDNGWLNLLVYLIDSALLSSCIYIFAFLADSIFGSSLKSRLLNLWRHLPAETIFTYIKDRNQDKRFTTEQAIEKYKEIFDNLPDNTELRHTYENAKWYCIYSKHRNIPMIYIANRDYLLCRDLYISTIVILIGYILISTFTDIVDFEWRCVIYLLAMLIITNISAWQKSKRLVLDVLAYDLQQSE